MYFHRNNKNGQSYLILHAKEWNRLKKQSRLAEKPMDEKKEYVKSIIEKSREWTKTWPDHEHGLLANYEKKQKKRRETEQASVKSEKEKQKFKMENKSLVAIKQARQKIFDNSFYGKQLLSAFHESKTLEERDVQIQFQKELEKKQNIENKKYQIPLCCSLELDKYKAEEEKCRRSTAVQLALQNKEIYEKQKAESINEREIQIQNDLEDIDLMRKLLEVEREAEDQWKLLQKEAMAQYTVIDKKTKDERAKSEADYNAKLSKCQKEKEALNYKINKVLHEMYKVKDAPWKKQVLDNFAQHEEEQRQCIDQLTARNNTLEKHRSNELEKQNKEKAIRDHKKRLQIAEANKLMATCKKVRASAAMSERSCDRQCLIVKSDKSGAKKKDLHEVKENLPPYFGPCNKLMSALKRRILNTQSWTGVNVAHQEFARNADDMLHDCKYKHSGRKVVDEYIKYNRLKSLDVPNYY